MSESAVLLLSDVVDSTQLTEQLDLASLTALWTAHDRAARALLQAWRGREIDKSDGFLLTFDSVADAAGFAQAYHQALQALPQPLATRVGIHVGPVTLRRNPEHEVALGAKPVEVEGAAKPLAARVMALARGGQTLLSPTARAALGEASPWRLHSHGHWRLKGLEAPIELFELGDAEAAFMPPPDAAKAWRVVRQGELWLPVREVRHTLPAERDSFVGREPALQELAQHFEHGARLVSLLGIGGTGKTRLAQRFGWTWLGDFPGGVWFCDLSQATTADGIVHAVAQGLELPLGQADPVQQIGQAIAGRGACLVILDNYEQVARHAEATLGRWLDKAREARFLVTTREVLGIVGEQAMALAPLPTDDGVALFMRRAIAATAAFAPAGEDAAAIGPLVKLLDGLPLAIELCAARVRVMPPRMLLQRMGERFKLLTSSGGRRDRQATMKATLDWSWDLLSEVERLALAQLSVFEGGFTLEAAEAVVDLSGAGDAPWVIDVIQALMQKSLARKASDVRFDLLKTVQHYASTRADIASRKSSCLRHWHYFAGIDERTATAERCADADNLVAACRRAIAAGACSDAGRLLASSWAVLKLTGPYQVAAELGEQVGQIPSCTATDRAIACEVAGSALFLLGRTEAARQTLLEGLNLPGSNATSVARIQCVLGELLASNGEYNEARRMLDLALSAALEPLMKCRMLNAMGGIANDFGRVDEARGYYERALEMATIGGDRRWQGGVLGNLGLVNHVGGQPERARLQYEESLTIAAEVGDRRWEGNGRCNLGFLHFESGRPADATRELSRALELARHLGHSRLQATVLCNMGLVEESLTRFDQAVRLLQASVDVAAQAGDVRLEGQFLGYLGRCLSARARFADAREVFGRAEVSLTAARDDASLALAKCWHAECEISDGRPASARELHVDAGRIAAILGANASAELQRTLARVAAVLKAGA